MTLEEQRLSEMVDGELPADDACRLLLKVLEDQESRTTLREMLELRLLHAPWRRLEPKSLVISSATRPASEKPRSWLRQLPGLCASAIVGGLLVLAGGLLFRGGPSEKENGTHRDAGHKPAVVSTQQMQEVAQVFAFHESVAGPLKWFAAGDKTIQLAPADASEANRRPVAVRLRIRADQSNGPRVTKEFTIVCREREPTTIRLSSDGSRFRVSLIPTVRDGRVYMQYAIECERFAGSRNPAALLGNRVVALQQTPLGQFALGDRLIDVDANAWPLQSAKL